MLKNINFVGLAYTAKHPVFAGFTFCKQHSINDIIKIKTKPMEDQNQLKIELVLKKDSTTEQVFALSQCDYNFSPPYYQDEDEKQPITFNLSGGVKSITDPLLLAWLCDQEGEWSGSIKLYKQEALTLHITFKKSKVTGCSQSFSEHHQFEALETYFSAVLKGVVLNDTVIN